MTLRDKLLQDQRAYEQALKDVEARKPEGRYCKLNAENGSEDGSLIHSPDTDTLTIIIKGAEIKIDGKYIKSINQFLNKLLSDTE